MRLRNFPFTANGINDWWWTSGGCSGDDRFHRSGTDSWNSYGRIVDGGKREHRARRTGNDTDGDGIPVSLDNGHDDNWLPSLYESAVTGTDPAKV